MTIDLYAIDISPPCRAVLLLMAALNLTPNFIEVNIMAGDQAKPEFTKLSPQHTVPTMIDGGLTLTESRAIMRYLTEKYGKDSGLIPDSVEDRAVMNQMLDFDLGTVAQRFMEKYVYPLKFGTPAPAYTGPNLDQAMSALNSFLEGRAWIAGKKMTIADFSYAATIATAVAGGYDMGPYKNIQNWYNKAKETMKGFEENEEGATKIGTFMKAMNSR